LCDLAIDTQGNILTKNKEMKKLGITPSKFRLFWIHKTKIGLVADPSSAPTEITDLDAKYEEICEEQEYIANIGIERTAKAIELMFKCEMCDECATTPKPFALVYEPKEGNTITVITKERENLRDVMRWIKRRNEYIGYRKLVEVLMQMPTYYPILKN
jgi:hypothetical protein